MNEGKGRRKRRSAFVAARKQIRRGEAEEGGKEREGGRETRGQPVTNDSQILPVNLISPRIPEKC